MGQFLIRCRNSECFYHNNAIPFPDDLPAIPGCPLCGSEMGAYEEKHWLTAAAENGNLWADDVAEQYPSVIAYEYRQLRNYCREKKAYAVLMNLKDNFEVLLKLETLLAYAWARDRMDEEFEQATLALLTSPNLSMGSWLELAGILLKNLNTRNQSLPEGQRKPLPGLFPLEKIRKFYAKNRIVDWRNSRIGHGSMQLEEDGEFQADVIEKLRLLKALFSEVGDHLKQQKLYCGDLLLTGAGYARKLECDGKIEFRSGDVRFSCDPFIVIRKHEARGNGVYFFDNQKKETQTLLQAYAEGSHSSEEVGYFSELRRKLEKGNIHLEERTDSMFLTEKESRELDFLQMSHNFVNPKHLTEWLGGCVKQHTKGIFLLQMERGMGKSVFTEQLNRLNDHPLEIGPDASDLDIRTYHISRTQTALSGDFENQTEWMWGQSYKHETDWIRVPRIRELKEKTKDPARALCGFLAAVREYSSGKRGRKKIMMVLDGLDEITNENLWEYIPAADLLTEGVYIFLTSRDPETENLPEQFAERLKKLQVQEILQVRSNSAGNERFLNDYINKTKLKSLDPARRNDLFEKAEHRVLQLGLYCRLLEGGMSWEALPKTDRVVEKYLGMLEDRLGEKEAIFAREILAILCTLGSLEALKIGDLGKMTAENGVTLRLAGMLRDLSPFLKTERTAEGSKYMIVNSDLAEKLAKQIPETVETVRQLVGDTMVILKNKSLRDEQWAEPLAAHVTELAQGWLPEKTEALGPDNEEILKQFVEFIDDCSDRLKVAHERERRCDYMQQQYLFCRERYGEDNPKTLAALMNLGSVLGFSGRYGEALPLLRESYERTKQVLGEDHPDTLLALNSLALNLLESGRYGEVPQLLKEVYEKSKRVLGEDHPYTLGALNNLGVYLDRFGRYEDALVLYQEVFLKRKRVLGENHPDTLDAFYNLANELSCLGRYGEALPLFRGVYAMMKRVLGEDHYSTLHALGGIANSLSKLGRYEEALPLSREVYERMKRMLGEDNPHTASALCSLAIDLMRLERYEESVAMMREVYETRKRVLGPYHPDTLAALYNVAYILSLQKNYNEAFPTARQVYEDAMKVLNEKHEFIQTARKLLKEVESQMDTSENSILHRVFRLFRS